VSDEFSDTESVSERAFDYDRTVALSDGVFAIALTLLVLTISFPELHSAQRHNLGAQLQDRFPQLLSYLLSFVVLAYLWLRHHVFFRRLGRIDGPLSLLNLAYLAVVAFLPYPTRLLGEYGQETVSVVIYALTIMLVTVMSGLMRLHVERAGLLAPGERLDAWYRYAVGPTVFGLSIVLAVLVSPQAAQYSWLLLLLTAPISRWAGRREAVASSDPSLHGRPTPPPDSR
jgi:TMEM175 potassium channel family protein